MFGFIAKILAKAAAKAAKNPILWKTIVRKAGETAVVGAAAYAANKGIDRLFRDRNISFEKKLKRLEKMHESGEISKKEYDAARKSLFETYSQHRA
jgi:hypothetical protein